MKKDFSLFPAIDLRNGQVVRLQEGDPKKQTTYGAQPELTAQYWLENGAQWLHVINLDGAFGEDSRPNLQALEGIVRVAGEFKARVQFGGGLRSLEAISRAFESGVTRIILGTAAITQPELLTQALATWGAERVAVSLDARGDEINTKGWQSGSGANLFDTAKNLEKTGLQWLVYTDIARDGMQTGFNREYSIKLARETNLNVIASGGVRDIDDVRDAALGGMAGIILGKALYEQKIALPDAFRLVELMKQGG